MRWVDRAWPVWPVLGVLACLVYTLIPAGNGGAALSAGTGLISVLLTVTGVRRKRLANPTAWLIFAAGQLLWVAGDLVYAVDALVLQAQPYPSWSDACYLAGYPLLVVGLFGLSRVHRPRDHARLLDTAVIASGLGLVYWVL